MIVLDGLRDEAALVGFKAVLGEGRAGAILRGWSTGLRVFADTNVCQSYANCVIEAPDMFDVDESSGKVHLIVATPLPGFEDDVRRAVAACPVRALSIEE